jgi:preprotein translocase subunit SecY
MSKNEKKYPKGYWMAVGISIGVAVGVALGPLFDNIGIGIAIGIAIGSGIGASLEQKNKDNIRPLTAQEQKRQKLGVVVGMTLTTLLLVALIIVYLMQTR